MVFCWTLLCYQIQNCSCRKLEIFKFRQLQYFKICIQKWFTNHLFYVKVVKSEMIEPVTQSREICSFSHQLNFSLWVNFVEKYCYVGPTGAYYGPIDFGLYSVKVISTDNSVQMLRNKKLNKMKCDFLGQIRLVRFSPDSSLPPPLEQYICVFRQSEWKYLHKRDHKTR